MQRSARCHGALLVNIFNSTEYFGHKVPGKA